MDLAQIDSEVRALEHWYYHHVRPLLERVEKLDGKPSRVVDFDAELDRLRSARSAYDGDLVVCFLGAAGIGKSTLINALVDGRRSVLPHGGIGPLTAQALRVRRGSPTSFSVEYHGPGQLWRLVKALEWGCRDELSAAGARHVVTSALDDTEFNEEERSDLEDLTRGDEAADSSPVQSYRKQAQLLVRGDQNASLDLFYLIDSLRHALDKPPIWGTSLEGQDTERIRRMREVLANGVNADRKPWRATGRKPRRSWIHS